LDQGGKIIADYIWIDGSGINLRSKARTLEHKISHISEIPDYYCDGSSTYMAAVEQSEVILKPVAFFKDPFRKGDNILVMCDTWMW
jgi:glutamine synthetase